MAKLIIISGPSGVGKNTLVDSVLKEFPKIKYFKKETTRDRRPDDRDAEANFLTQKEFDKLKIKYRIALPYQVRGKDYGLPVKSFVELKYDPRIICLSDFNLITSLRDVFDTTTIYVTAPTKVIKERLEKRIDTSEQRKKSIDSVEEHLNNYDKFRDLFDYTITNSENLKNTKNEIIEIVKKEISLHKKVYNFLLPSTGQTQGRAQYELNNEPGSLGKFRSLPTHDVIMKALENNMETLYYGGGILPSRCNIRHGPVSIVFYSHYDKERYTVSYGSFELQGPKFHISKTCALLEEIFPELKSYQQK